MNKPAVNPKALRKPSNGTWVGCAILISLALLNLHGYVQQGYVQIGKNGYYVQYTGASAIGVIAVPLGLGLYGLALTLRAWRAYRKQLKGG
jgi:hypothetical protein